MPRAASDSNRTNAAPAGSLRGQMRRRPLPYDANLARRHIAKRDPVMREIVRRVGPYALEVRGRPYESLLRAILYQQLAGPAAAAIERRFMAIFGGIPTPGALLSVTDDALRAAGVSRQKAGYMRSLAEHFDSGAISDRELRRAPDDEVIAQVTQVKGVGRWTADMLLLFCLGRPDVLPVGDLGVQNSLRTAYGLDASPSAGEMEALAEPWRPYRSAATWYLWRRGDLVTL
ncbi:MAG TPA: DNA-3-methyladenine glycosylase 2 family protein [Dehalococcoidia bacterium]|nr:DNA-3-methyladenine glycosylase 2 family protein [Dehalococcoidia bacterium]